MEMDKLFETLREYARVIRNEKATSANTALRIGDMYLSIIDAMEAVDERVSGIDLDGYATKEALKGYLALVGDAQTVKGTVYFDGAYFNNVPFADVGSKSVRMATMDDVPGFTPLLDEGVEIARVDIGGQQVFLYAPKAASVDLTNYYTKDEIAKVALTGSYNDLIDKPTIPSLDGYATEGWVNGKLGGYQTIITEANKLPYSLISGTPSLATVATSGNYNDLAGKPAIPSVVDSLVSEAVADALSAKQGKVLNDAVGALRTALTLVENSYLDKTNPTVTGNMTVSGLLSAGSLSVGGRSIGMAAFYGVGNTVASGNYELITGGGVYTALQGYATTGALAGYLPTIGGTLTGALRVESMLTVTGVSEIAMLSCPKGLVVGDDQESGQAFKSFTNMFGWNGDGADLTEDWTWMIGKDGRATFGLLNATNLTLADGGVAYAGVYHDDSWGVYLWNEAAQAGFGLTDDGIPHVNGLSVLYVGNYDLYLDGVYAKKATTLSGYGITDNIFIPRATLISNENADDLAYNGVYLNATGNGSGNSNFPNLYSAFLNFYQAPKYRGQLSIGTSLWFRRKVDDWEPWRECLDSSNFSNYALPLSGGTIDGELTATGILSSSSYLSFGIYGSLIMSDVRNSWRTSVFGDSDNDSKLRTIRTDVSITDFCEIYGSGIVWCSGDTHGYLSVSYGSEQAFIGGGNGDNLNWSHTLIHSGNIGSQNVNYATSAGNAGTLGGYSLSSVTLGSLYKGYMAFSASVAADQYWYVKAVYATAWRSEFNKFEVTADYGNKNGKLSIELGGYSQDAGSYIAKASLYNDNNVRGFKVVHELVDGEWREVLYLKMAGGSGANVGIYSTMPTMAAKSWVVSEADVAHVSFTDVKYNNIYTNYKINGQITYADKLSTARTIWGQSFDGSGDITGSIKTDSWGVNIDDYGRLCRTGYQGDTSHNSDGVELVSTYGVVISTGNTAKSLAINPNGNVLIGTTEDSGYKLYVNGNSCVNGELYASRLFVGGKEIAADGSGAGFNGGTITGALRVENNIESIGMITGKYLVASHGMQVGDGTEYEGIGFRCFTDMFGWNGNDADLTEDWRWMIRKDGAATFVTVSQGSDARMKSVLGDVRVGLAEMANAPLVLFDWKSRENDRHHVGTIAQYWEAALPEVVMEAQNGMMTLAYGELGVAMGISLAKEVQELTEEVQRLRDENRALAQRLNNAGVA